MNTTCVAKAEIAKPLDGRWDEIGHHMRDLSRLWFRMLQTGIDAAHLASAKNEPISSPIYDAVVDFIKQDREWNAKSIDSSAKRKKLQPGQIAARDRRSKLEVPSLVYAVAARRAEHAWKVYLKEKHAGTRAIPSFEDHTSFCVRCDAWEIEKEGRGYVLAVKLHGGAAEWTRFVLSPEGGAAFDHFRRLALLKKVDKLTMKPKYTEEEQAEVKALRALKKKRDLTPEEKARLDQFPSEVDVPLGPDAVKTGDLQIRWVERRCKKGGADEGKKKGMWMAYATYTRELQPIVMDTSRVMAIHRGMHSLLTYATLEGASGILVSGDDILEHKRRYHARRVALQKHRRSRGAGGIGHGMSRTHREYGSLEDAEARFVETQCQQWAAKAIQQAKANGCGLILIEDYSTIQNDRPRFLPSWPWAKAKSAVKAAAQREGIIVREVPSAYISQTCPACQHVSPENRLWGGQASSSTAAARIRGEFDKTGRGDMFHCVKCDFHRHVDPVAAFNMLRTADGFDDTTFEKFERELRKFQRVLEQAAEPSDDSITPEYKAKMEKFYTAPTTEPSPPPNPSTDAKKASEPVTFEDFSKLDMKGTDEEAAE